MTTKKSALDGFKLQYEDLEDKKTRLQRKAHNEQIRQQQKAEAKARKKAERKTKKAKRGPSALRMYANYWLEVMA